jgi:hypothetical protein
LQIFEEPGDLFVVLDMVSESPQPWLLRQRPELSFDPFKLAGRNSAASLKGEDNGIPQQLLPALPLHRIICGRFENRLQCSYA